VQHDLQAVAAGPFQRYERVDHCSDQPTTRRLALSAARCCRADFYIEYACVLGYLIYKNAGHVWGLDRVFSRVPLFRSGESLHPLVA
jgi:hypothetical protein